MILRARWVLPIGAPPLRDGAVLVRDGRISRVGPADGYDAADGIPAAECIDLGDAVLMPGFVNAHAHLELTDYAGRCPPGPLWDWLGRLIALRRAPGAAGAEMDAVRSGARRSLAAGVTCVADISRTGAPFAALLESPIRKVCFFELISGAADPPGDPRELGRCVEAFLERAAGRADAAVGLSPHSLYTVAWNDVRRVAELAAERRWPVTMHVAETPDEVEWLERRTGRAAAFLSGFAALRSMEFARGAPAAELHRAGLTRRKPLLAHCNYLDDAQIAMLAETDCSVAFCPRAHRFFGHTGHPWRNMLAAGVNVCVGTDSLASNESLSILDELRFLRRAEPQALPASLLEMGTLRGARALELADSIGALRPGLWADLTAIPLSNPRVVDPVADLLDHDAMPARTWVAGVEVGRE